MGGRGGGEKALMFICGKIICKIHTLVLYLRPFIAAVRSFWFPRLSLTTFSNRHPRRITSQGVRHNYPRLSHHFSTLPPPLLIFIRNACLRKTNAPPPCSQTVSPPGVCVWGGG